MREKTTLITKTAVDCQKKGGLPKQNMEAPQEFLEAPQQNLEAPQEILEPPECNGL